MGVVQLVQAHQHTGGVGTAARHTGAHRHPFVDGHVHTGQKPRVAEKGHGGLDGGVFIVDRHKAARQRQRKRIAAAQCDFFV